MADEGTAGPNAIIADSIAAGEAGQGTTEPEGVFAPYLQEVPEEHRTIVSGYLKDAEKNVNTKLQEAADLRQRFGDYKDIDLNGITPEQLSNVIAFVRDVGSSPEAYQDWLRTEATEAGLLKAEEDAQEDPDLEQYIQSRIQAALNPVTQKLTQFEQQTQQQQQAEQQAGIEHHIESTFKEIEARDKIKLSEEQQEAILALGEQIQDDDFVEQGYAKLRALEGGAQAGLVKDKAAQPAPSLRSGGQPAPAKGKTFADVRGQAEEILSQML